MPDCSKCKKPTATFPITKNGKPSSMCQHCYDWMKIWNAQKYERAIKAKENPPEGMDLCMACRRMRPLSDFATNPYQRRKIAWGVTEAKSCADCRKTRAENRKNGRHAKLQDPIARRKYLDDRRDYGRQFRDKLLIAYGGKCVCCGETEPKFLELDHVESDGWKHRKEIGYGPEPLYRWAERNGFPPTLQILCANCHNAKSFWGECPHKASATPYLVERPA